VGAELAALAKQFGVEPAALANPGAAALCESNNGLDVLKKRLQAQEDAHLERGAARDRSHSRFVDHPSTLYQIC
jgi:hypothetical protein